MASSAFCLCRATSLLIPYMFLATLVLPVSLSSGKKPTHTFCSGLSRTSSPAATAGEVERFLGAVSAGAHSAFHRSYNASLYIDAKNRTMYAVAQCRPDVPASYCAACLAASSLFLAAGAASCADSAVWHDRCFLRYSERDTSRFRGDELAATVFNSSGRPARHGIAAVTGLLAAVMDRLDRSMQKRRLLGSTRAADGIAWGWGTANCSAGLVYGVARCAPGIARADCGRCLRGALAVAERDYNGSAGMQVLRLSCMARYESYPFYNASLLSDDIDPSTTTVGTTVGTNIGTEVAPPAPDHTNVGTVVAPPPPDHTSVGTVVAPPAPEHPSNRTNITAPISPPNGRNAFPPAAHGHGLPVGKNSTVPTSGGPSPAAPPKEKSHRRTRILLIVLIATGVAVGAMLLSFWSHRKR